MKTSTNYSVMATLLALRQARFGSCRTEPTLWRDRARVNKRVDYASGFHVCGPSSPASVDDIERFLRQRGKGADRVIVRPPLPGDNERRYCWILESSLTGGTGLRYSFDTGEPPENFARAAPAFEEGEAIADAIGSRYAPGSGHRRQKSL